MYSPHNKATVTSTDAEPIFDMQLRNIAAM